MTPRPIDTAPKDQFILIFSSAKDRWYVGKWDRHWKAFSQSPTEFHEVLIHSPSHWLPVPPSPFQGVEGVPGWYL
jgi:hypothetical protein